MTTREVTHEHAVFHLSSVERGQLSDLAKSLGYTRTNCYGIWGDTSALLSAIAAGALLIVPAPETEL